MIDKRRKNSTEYRLNQLKKLDTKNMTIVDIAHSIGGPEGSIRTIMNTNNIPYKTKKASDKKDAKIARLRAMDTESMTPLEIADELWIGEGYARLLMKENGIAWKGSKS